MHARLQTVRVIPDQPDAAQRATMLDIVAGHPGFAGACLLEQIGHGRGTMLTLWHSERDAQLAPERTAAQLGPRPLTLEHDEVYEVDDDWPGAPDVVPAVASLVWLDGPLSELHLRATRVAGRERIQPTMALLPTAGRAIALWQPLTRSYVVIAFAATLEDLELGHRTIMATKLLPGEDPALLPGADRVDLHRIITDRTLATAAPAVQLSEGVSA